MDVLLDFNDKPMHNMKNDFDRGRCVILVYLLNIVKLNKTKKYRMAIKYSVTLIPVKYILFVKVEQIVGNLLLNFLMLAMKRKT